MSNEIPILRRLFQVALEQSLHMFSVQWTVSGVLGVSGRLFAVKTNAKDQISRGEEYAIHRHLKMTDGLVPDMTSTRDLVVVSCVQVNQLSAYNRSIF